MKPFAGARGRAVAGVDAAARCCGSGSDFTGEPAIRDVEPAALAAESLPSVLTGPLPPGAFGVHEELAVDGVAHTALERSERFLLRLALGHLAVK